MFARLLKRLFGGRGVERVASPSRPVSPRSPSPPVVHSGLPAGPTATMPPPPPPPNLVRPEEPPEAVWARAEPASEVVPPVRAAAPPASEPSPPVAADPPASAAGAPDTGRGTAPETRGDPDPHEPVPGLGEVPSEGSRVKLVLEDGTLAAPALDEELAERLRYIVDNIVTPPEQPST